LPAKSPLRAPLREHGIRLTKQRELLFELIHNSHKHLNADQLYELAKKRDPKINRVTVYRTLKVLKQEGLVDELDLLHVEGDQHYYETRLKREHAHVVCLRCGSVQEFFGDPIKQMKQDIESNLGFRIEIARTEIGGYCADCQSQEMGQDDDEAETAGAGSASSAQGGSRRRPARSKTA